MSQSFGKILSAELVLVSLTFQILFGGVVFTSAANPVIHDTIETHTAVDAYAFDMEGTTYLAIGNISSGYPATIVIPQMSGVSLPFQDLLDSASSFEYFTISGESYLAVAQRYTDDVIYKYDGGSFVESQKLPSNIQASAFQLLIFSGAEYLAVASDSPTDYSKMMQWTGTGFVESFDIGAMGNNSDIEAFEMKDIQTNEFSSDTFLPYAQLLADNSIITSATESEYRLTDKMTRGELARAAANLGGFVPVACQGNIYDDVDTAVVECGYIEALALAGMIDMTTSYRPGAYVTKIDTVELLLRVLGESSSNGTSSYTDFEDFSPTQIGYALRSQEMNCTGNNTDFLPYYSLSRGQAYMILSCLSGLDASVIAPIGTIHSTGSYLALGDGKIYTLSTTGSVSLIQDLSMNGPADVQFVEDNYGQYLIYLSHGSGILYVYRWNGAQFILSDDSIHTSSIGGTKLGFDTFYSKGKSYIVTTLGQSNSYIYQLQYGALKEYQSIVPSDSYDGHSWTQFKLGGKQMLFLSNGNNTNDSYIFEWSEVPYAVVDSPVSGESYTPRIWDPAITPITGHGEPDTAIMIYDGSGTTIGSGGTNERGDFSIMTTANTGSVLPIRVVPYSGSLVGDEKTISYLDIRPTPIPTSSRPSGAFNSPFTLTISGELPHYASENSIEYAVYEEGLFTVSGEFYGTQNISIGTGSTRVEYKGVSASGVATANQVREYYYDTTAPTLSHDVTTSLVSSVSQPVDIQGMTDVQMDIDATVYSPNITRIDIHNPSLYTDVKLENLTIGINPQSGMSYSGTVCLREVGSTSFCNSYDSGSGKAVTPGINVLNFDIPNNDGTISFGLTRSYEIYTQLDTLLPPSHIVRSDIVSLNYDTIYNSNMIAFYDGADSVLDYEIGGVQVNSMVYPTGVSAQLDTFFVTGPTAQVELQAYDDGLYFGEPFEPTFPLFADVITGENHSYTYIGNHGLQTYVNGNKGVTVGKNLVQYKTTDNVGNVTGKSFLIYRVPELTQPTISYSGSTVYAQFQSDATVSGEYSYTTPSGQTYSGQLDIPVGDTVLTLTGVTLSGTLDFTIGLASTLSGMTLPGAVYTAAQKNIMHTFDAIPDTLTIPLRTSIGLGQVVEYGPYTLSGFNVPLLASVSTGSMSVNGQVYTTGAVLVSEGDILRIQLIAPTTYTTTKNGVLMIGNIAMPYALETLMAPPVISVPPVSVVPTSGGGGGGGSSSVGSIGISAISSLSSSANFSSTMIQGLLLNNLSMTPRISATIDYTNLRTTLQAITTTIVVSLEKDIENTQGVFQKMRVINNSIETYHKKMIDSKILSSEYLIYRNIKRDLKNIKRSIR